MRSEIERCRDRIAALTGGPGAFFRPSAAQHATPEVLRLAGAAGYATVLSYDVDSRDFTDPGADRDPRRCRRGDRGLGREHASRPPRHARRPARAARRSRRPGPHPGHRERPVPLIERERSRAAACPPDARLRCRSAPCSPSLAGCAAPAPAVTPPLRPPRRLHPPSRPPSGLPGMPPVRDPHNVYADAGPGMLSEAAKAARPMVYVPHTKTGEVWTIDPATYAVVGRYRLGGELQHVVPVVGHAHALREQRHRQPAHAVRPAHGPARQADPGDRPVQPVLHAGRALGDLGGRGPAPAGVLRPAHLGRPADPRHPGLRGHRPLRRHPRRAHGRVHLRVRGPRRRDRPGGRAGSSA